jgi:hypothetical protein
MKERDFPNIVELPLPDGGFGARIDEFEASTACAEFKAGTVVVNRRDEQEYVRWCFASVTDADDFAQRFGGSVLVTRPPFSP